jgi:hypothetical protein
MNHLSLQQHQDTYRRLKLKEASVFQFKNINNNLENEKLELRKTNRQLVVSNCSLEDKIQLLEDSIRDIRKGNDPIAKDNYYELFRLEYLSPAGYTEANPNMYP